MILEKEDQLEKLTAVQPFKKSPGLYGTRRFITVSTRARH
jgi:hypothetical protein